MTLHSSSVEQIFARMLVRYGAMWLRMFDGVDDEALKADWASVLGGLPEWAIRYGLENLPADRPPTAMQFRAICATARSDAPALPYSPPPKNPTRAAEVRRQVAALTSKTAAREWIDRLLERKRNGEVLTFGQLEALERAKNSGALPFQAIGGEFTPPPFETLPPGMRGQA